MNDKKKSEDITKSSNNKICKLLSIVIPVYLESIESDIYLKDSCIRN